MRICYRGKEEAIDMENEKGKRKGLFAAIRESMTKTGGCCGPGETCGGPAKEDNKATFVLDYVR